MRMPDAGQVTFFDPARPWLESRRNIVFVYNDPGTDAIFIKGIDDVREPEVTPWQTGPARTVSIRANESPDGAATHKRPGARPPA